MIGGSADTGVDSHVAVDSGTGTAADTDISKDVEAMFSKENEHASCLPFPLPGMWVWKGASLALARRRSNKADGAWVSGQPCGVNSDQYITHRSPADDKLLADRDRASLLLTTAPKTVPGMAQFWFCPSLAGDLGQMTSLACSVKWD